MRATVRGEAPVVKESFSASGSSVIAAPGPENAAMMKRGYLGFDRVLLASGIAWNLSLGQEGDGLINFSYVASVGVFAGLLIL
ncbi:hypothetical protein H5P28_11955 [Ruficoccus amylovorans]|uniref:Uncharacterized protein n=1 Tax=Ruficoccus amylovorans TaxID=1804625 RepID=A0A842HIC4_9BACT|nr:hypothetical protein [Ruficoccus amylovorans]MBC2594971.1 hypothetical protein [Ruficoccus amylovorans]